ncbi:MAG: hypothetical protein HZC50_12485 [Nitrospirae bacterium]|nr:hypothetical protein [Nitrospirota bacterium]
MTRSVTLPKPVRSTVTRTLVHWPANGLHLDLSEVGFDVALSRNERARRLLGFQKREKRRVALLASEVDRTFAG